MKNDRWVFYKDAKPEAGGAGVVRRVLAYSDDLMVVENTFEKGLWGPCIIIPTHRSPMW